MKEKEAEKMIPPTRREEPLIKDCGKLMQRSVDTAINKAKAGLERELTVFLERELTAFHREIYPVLDSNQNQLINRLDNTLDRHLDTANEHTMDIVSGKHPLMTEKMKALRMENEALKEKLQKYVDQDYVMKTAKNSNLMWPKNMPVFYEVQKVRGTRAKLEILHEGLVPRRKGYDYLDWLTKRINSAVDNAECDRWLLNHVAYFSERKFAKMTVGMDVRCEHCNQFFLAKSM